MLYTGGPAFPVGGSHGMTMRDYFAAKAMQGYINDQEFVDACGFMGKDVKKETARISYQMADAMMKVRDE